MIRAIARRTPGSMTVGGSPRASLDAGTRALTSSGVNWSPGASHGIRHALPVASPKPLRVTSMSAVERRVPPSRHSHVFTVAWSMVHSSE